MQTINLIIFFALAHQPHLSANVRCQGQKPLTNGALCTIEVVGKKSTDGYKLVRSCDGFRTFGAKKGSIGDLKSADLVCDAKDPKHPRLSVVLK